jgi:hypothetical protein
VWKALQAASYSVLEFAVRDWIPDAVYNEEHINDVGI